MMQVDDARIFPMEKIEEKVAKGANLEESQISEMVQYARGNCPGCYGRGYEIRLIQGIRHYFPCTHTGCALDKIKKLKKTDFIRLISPEDESRNRLNDLANRIELLEEEPES